MRIHHLALRVTDPERSLAFYAGLLGLTELRRFGQNGSVRSIWLSAGPTILMLERTLRSSGPMEGSGHVLAFAVDDLGKWDRRLTEAGITVERRSEHTIYIHDPDGHRVGFTTYPVTPPFV